MNIFFNDDVLLDVARDRGYMTVNAVAKALAAINGKSWKSIVNQIKNGRISFEDSFLLANHFQMTPKEYCDTFLNGLFVVDSNGHYVAKVDDIDWVITPNLPPNSKAMIQKRRQERMKKMAEEIKAELKKV